VDFIRFNKLTGSKNNHLLIVFDGYPPSQGDIPAREGMRCLFSGVKEADELIKKIVQDSASPKNIVVVSDDKEVQLTSRFLRAQICSVGDFICSRRDSRLEANKKKAALDFKLSYSEMQKINAELKKKWLE
jgi:hypothetical protein